MINAEKTPEDILKEELLKERAVVLGRTGESVQKALDKLRTAEAVIEKLREHLSVLAGQDDLQTMPCGNPAWEKRQAVAEINKQIDQYNRMREYAKLRYYYLIVTREALGLRRHGWVEKAYPIPPKKNYFLE
ncbi:MAG: hypothetical protein JW943_04935 [Deltaproteobacteria bacterium]|nr:hypothetical protein [Deltaproteobacteria bacterium]